MSEGERGERPERILPTSPSNIEQAFRMLMTGTYIDKIADHELSRLREILNVMKSSLGPEFFIVNPIEPRQFVEELKARVASALDTFAEVQLRKLHACEKALEAMTEDERLNLMSDCFNKLREVEYMILTMLIIPYTIISIAGLNLSISSRSDILNALFGYQKG